MRKGQSSIGKKIFCQVDALFDNIIFRGYFVSVFEFQIEMIFRIVGESGKLRNGKVRRVIFVDIIFDDGDFVVVIDLFVFLSVHQREHLHQQGANHVFVIGEFVHVFVVDLFDIGLNYRTDVVMESVVCFQTAFLVKIKTDGNQVCLNFVLFVVNGIRFEDRIAVIRKGKGFGVFHILSVQIKNIRVLRIRFFYVVFDVRALALRFIIVYELVAIVQMRADFQRFAFIISYEQILEFNHISFPSDSNVSTTVTV